MIPPTPEILLWHNSPLFFCLQTPCTSRQAYVLYMQSILKCWMLNGQAMKKRQTVRMQGFCYACLSTFELFPHARIPTFTATFVKNRVEMLLHRFALFFHCVIEVFVVLVCQLGVVFYKSQSFRVLSMIFVEIQLVMRACYYPTDHMECLP